MKKENIIIVIICIILAVVIGVIVIASNYGKIENKIGSENTNINYEKDGETIQAFSKDNQMIENVPLSNSNVPAGEIVFKYFDVKSNEMELLLNDWQMKEDNLYYKEIKDYQEYKNLTDNYSELRKMTETDFKNYFPIVILTKNTSKILQYKGMNNTNIRIEYKENENQSEDLQYSGVVVIMPKTTYKDSIIEIEVKGNS